MEDARNRDVWRSGILGNRPTRVSAGFRQSHSATVHAAEYRVVCLHMACNNFILFYFT